MKIFLIGFMGSGKSFVSRQLAEAMEWSRLDLDEYIVEKYEAPIVEIFEAHGEAHFRQLETEALEEVIRQPEHMILACGGGTPCFANNMAIMNAAGLTVFLDADEALIFERIKDTGHKRPLLKEFSQQEMKAWIASKLAERLPFYEQAHISVPLEKNGDYQELIDFFVAIKSDLE